MPAVDPFVSLRDWRFSLFRGGPAQVDQFLDRIDATLPAEWIRDRDFERARLRPDRIRCYLFDGAGEPSLQLWLQRVTETRIRGGAIQVLRHPPSGDAGRIGQVVAEFTDRCVLPAATSAQIFYTRPSFGPRSVVTSGAETLFTQFADAVDGQWPLAGRAEELWEELISTCLTEQVAIDRSELSKWLADSGWELSAVTPLVDRFFADAQWLAKRLAAMAP